MRPSGAAGHGRSEVDARGSEVEAVFDLGGCHTVCVDAIFDLRGCCTLKDRSARVRGRRPLRSGRVRRSAGRCVRGALRVVDAAGWWGFAAASPTNCYRSDRGRRCPLPSAPRGLCASALLPAAPEGAGSVGVRGGRRGEVWPDAPMWRKRRSSPSGAPHVAPRHTAHAALEGGGCSTPVAPVTDREGEALTKPHQPAASTSLDAPPTPALTTRRVPQQM